MYNLLGLTGDTKGDIYLGSRNSIFLFQEDPEFNIKVSELIDYMRINNKINYDLFIQHMKSFNDIKAIDKNTEECSLGQKRKYSYP